MNYVKLFKYGGCGRCAYKPYTVPEIEHVNREISKLKVDFKGNHK